MILHAFGKTVLWFSQQSDGDLKIYNPDTEGVHALWKSIPFVSERNIPFPGFADQIHGDTLLEVSSGSRGGNQGVGDALCTFSDGIALGVFTADCLPILIWNDECCAAVHAGWKGTRAAIAYKSVSEICRRRDISPRNLNVFMGPCIGQCCLEVGEEVAAEFKAADESFMSYFSRGGKWHLDLRGLNAFQLLQAGILPVNIRNVNDCTYCLKEAYFSYRRAKKRGKTMFSGIINISSKG